jgi:hypothetical protein
MYYEPPGEEERPGCRDVLVLTRAVYAALLPPIFAMIVVLATVTATVIMFARHPALALVPLAVGGTLLALFVLWERRRYHPPEL